MATVRYFIFLNNLTSSHLRAPMTTGAPARPRCGIFPRLPPCRLGLSLLALLGTLFTSACSGKFYRNSADRETFRILQHKGAYVPNMERDFSIEPPGPVSLKEFGQTGGNAEFLGEYASSERDARILSLADALAVAVTHNREYRNRKELLYLQALDLTLVRHQFSPLLTGTGNLEFQETTRAIEENLDNLVRDSTFTRRASFGIDLLLKTGARISSSVTADFLKFVNGDLRTINNSSVVTTFSQPLLRGAGYRATTEGLTQAERDLFYALRDFARFRKEFTVRIASEYFRILQARDAVKNNYLGYQGFKISVEREEALADEDRTTQAELGQLRQAELNNELQWINALRNYSQLLDQFKIDLGIPVTENIVLDDSELGKLEIIDPVFSRDKAAEVAVATRLDLSNSREQHEDTARRILVTAQDLLPGADLVGAVDVGSPPSTQVLGIDSRLNDWSVGLDVDLPLDNKEERNAYRSALISHQRTARELELAEDRIRLEVYDASRNLETARKQFEISQLGVELAQKRLEEQNLLMELGRGTARDLVDARNDLTNSQNDYTGAIINHTTSRLNFWRDMGILFITKDGKWEKKLYAEGR